jgi:hypothetical protein
MIALLLVTLQFIVFQTIDGRNVHVNPKHVVSVSETSEARDQHDYLPSVRGTQCRAHGFSFTPSSSTRLNHRVRGSPVFQLFNKSRSACAESCDARVRDSQLQIQGRALRLRSPFEIPQTAPS